MKMFDHCVARIALSWNDNVLSAYHIASLGECEQLGDSKKNFFPICFSPRGLKGVFWCKNNLCKFFLTLIYI